MQTFQSAHNEFMLLIGHTSPITHRLAADRIHRMSELAKTGEERRSVAQATHVWLTTLTTLVRMAKQLTDETLPLIVIVKQDMDKGSSGQGAPAAARRQTPVVVGPACDDCKEDDGFLDDVPFEETKAPKPVPQKVRPSRVIQPGPLEPLQRALKAFDIEDELRTWCVYGPRMNPDGSIPRGPLVDGPTIKSHDMFIVWMYRAGKVQRPWAASAVWDWETALVEDVILLLILVHDRCSVARMNLHIERLRPFVRSLGEHKLGFAGYRAVRRLAKAGVIAKCKPSTYEFRVGWEEKIRLLLTAWEQAEKLECRPPFSPPANGGQA